MISNDFLKITYDSERKLWKSENHPYKNLTSRSLGAAFLQSMRSLQPDKILEYHYDEQKNKSVRDLYEEAITVAVSLKELGMEKGDVVVLFSGYSYLTSSLTFGALLMGGVVNFFEVKLNSEEIAQMLDTVQPFMILYEENFLPKIINALKRFKPKSLKYMLNINGSQNASVANVLLKPRADLNYDEFQAVSLDQPEEEVAFLVFTSGSTGLPKVTQLTHCLLLHGVYAWWANPFNYEPLNSNSLLFSLSPLRWISQIGLLLQSAILGIKRICAHQAGTGCYGLEILRNTKPTHIFSVPSFFYEILLELEEGDVESLDSLKYIQLGGESPSSVIIDLCKKFAVNSRLFYSYGMSETACSIANDEHISGGQLLPGFEMQVLNENFQPVAHNQQGQLAIRAPYPFKGYRDKDQNQCFLDNGFFLNGDFGYFDQENTLHMLGRLKDLIKSGKILLIPTLVESLVLNVCEVTAARLVGYQRSAQDSQQEVAALFVVLKKGSVVLSPEQLSIKIYAACADQLSKEELAVIQNIYFDESFPLTTCGKIDRFALKDLALKRATLH